MSDKIQNTENTILEAAGRVFVMHGFEGATMQMIASEAGINKALLHYYFRSKEKLFEAAFKNAFQKFIPSLLTLITSNETFEEKIRLFVSHYIDSIQANPFIPLFIMREMHRNSDRLLQLVWDSGINPTVLIAFVEDGMNSNMKNIDPKQFVINLLSLCIFPFAGRPLIQGVFFENDPQKYDAFLEERKKAVGDFIIQSLK